MHKIDILMAAYNSEKYISAQLDSILQQTYTDFQITICDDFSTDNTINILSKYKMQYNNINYIKNHNNIGVKENFSKLLLNSNAEYIMFSDHDDVWINNKIEISYNKMLEMEKIYSKDTPILVFCDKYVTDENLNILYSSHNKLEKFNTKKISLNRLLMANIISGCTIIINKALKDICGNINKNACMHDYWLALCAASFGKIGFIKEPLIYYRQHCSNQLGVKIYTITNILNSIKQGKANIQKNVIKNITQAESFYNQYENKLCEENKLILQKFISLQKKRNIKFIYSVIKNNFYKPGIVKNIGLLYAFL